MIFMTEKDWEYVNALFKNIEDLRQRKKEDIEAIQRYYRTGGGYCASFPSVCKQPMTDILCAYYDREIAMAQAKLNAVEIRFGSPGTDSDSQSDTGV
jgi:hypothetical protein